MQELKNISKGVAIVSIRIFRISVPPLWLPATMHDQWKGWAYILCSGEMLRKKIVVFGASTFRPFHCAHVLRLCQMLHGSWSPPVSSSIRNSSTCVTSVEHHDVCTSPLQSWCRNFLDLQNWKHSNILIYMLVLNMTRIYGRLCNGTESTLS